MMTTNLFVIANVKLLRTGGSFRVLLPFFRTSWGVGVLNSAIFNSFHNRVEFGTILDGLRNFGGWGFEPPNPPPLSVRHCPERCKLRSVAHSQHSPAARWICVVSPASFTRIPVEPSVFQALNFQIELTCSFIMNSRYVCLLLFPSIWTFLNDS